MPGYELFGIEERDAVNQLFDANNGVLAAHGFADIRRNVFRVREFESALAARLDIAKVQVVSSGTAALAIALRAAGVGPDDEVISQAFTFVATVEAVLAVGARPVLVEVDDSLTMEPSAVAARITPRTKAIVPVHMAGAACDMEKLMSIAEQHRIPVIEDAAQAFGGTYRGRPLGTFGIAGVYSFDFAKTITTGEGGAIVSEDESFYRRCRALHDHGHDYDPQVPRGKDTRSIDGFNHRMTEVQAAIGIAQLRKLDHILAVNRRRKQLLKQALSHDHLTFRRLHDPAGDIADTLVFFLETADEARDVARRLEGRGITTKNLPDALGWHFAGHWHHLSDAFESVSDIGTAWPKTRALLERAIALPISARADEPEIDPILDALRHPSTSAYR